MIVVDFRTIFGGNFLKLLKFNIKTTSSNHYFQCFVLNNKQEMYKFYKEKATKIEKTYGIKLPEEMMEHSEHVACIFPFTMHDEEGKLQNLIGYVFLTRENENAVVNHELLHCALWYDRVVNGNIRAFYGSTISPEEERLAYIFSDLITVFQKKIRF